MKVRTFRVYYRYPDDACEYAVNVEAYDAASAPANVRWDDPRIVIVRVVEVA